MRFSILFMDNIEIKSILLRNTKMVVSIANGSDLENYDSRIEDINNEALFISMPTKRGRPIAVHKDTVLTASVIVATGRVTFKSKVQYVVKKPIYMLAIDIPSSITHEQLRQFYRVPVYMRATFYLGSMDTLKMHEAQYAKIEYESALIDDLSGGGCRISTFSEIRDGDSIVLDFDGTPIEGVGRVECKVVRMVPSGSGKRQVSLVYSDIAEKKRDKIVRYVFRRQMELRHMEAIVDE